jgi:hypothetical protein
MQLQSMKTNFNSAALRSSPDFKQGRKRAHFHHPNISTGVYPKVYRLAAWSENCTWYSALLLGAVYRYFVSQSSEFCRHNLLCCFSRSNTKSKRVFRYRLSPETFGYTLVRNEMKCTHISTTVHRVNMRMTTSIPPFLQLRLYGVVLN